MAVGGIQVNGSRLQRYIQPQKSVLDFPRVVGKMTAHGSGIWIYRPAGSGTGRRFPGNEYQPLNK